MAAKTSRASRLSSINHPDHGLYIQKCCTLKEKKGKILCEETAAANIMKTLTAKYGARGKSAKTVFLQGIKHGAAANQSTSISRIRKGKLEKSTARPPAMVLHSRFCKRLESLIRSQTFRLGPLPSILELSALYDEAGSLEYDPEDEEENGQSVNRIIPELLEQQEYLLHLRHKICQRAMGALILQFDAYQPLLKYIKASYDSVMKMKKQQLLELSWTAQSIQIAHTELLNKAALISFEGMKVYKLMEEQCDVLSKHIDKQDSALQLMSVILENLETSLGDEYEQRKDSDDQNIMLIQAINGIRSRLGLPARPPTPDSVTPVAEEENLELEDEDVNGIMRPFTPNDSMILRRALDICNFDLGGEIKRLEILAEEHKNEVPRHIYLEAEKKAGEMHKEVEEFEKRTLRVQTDLQDITGLIDKCIKERDEYKKKVEEIRRKLTPRPSWDKVGEYFEGGVPRWKPLYEGKSSSLVANKVVEELHAMTIPAPLTYFAGMGEEADIPRVLRYSGQIRDRRIGRRDAEFIINDIWIERRALLDKLVDSTTQAPDPTLFLNEDDPFAVDQPSSFRMTDFQEYVALYFDNKFTSAEFKIEWIYNIFDACKRLSLSRKLQQFAASLFLRTEERCFHTFREEFLSLRFILSQASSRNNPPEMSFGDFKNLLSRSYPKKNPDNLKKLIRLASKQCKAHADWTPIKFENLFLETDEGFEGRFFEELYDQLEEERMEFIKDILKILTTNLGTFHDIEQEHDTGGETLVHVFNLSDAIAQAEPQLSVQDKACAIAWVYFKVSIVSPVEQIRELIAAYLETQHQDAMTQSNFFDRVVHGIQSVFDKDGLSQGPIKRNPQAPSPTAPYPKEIKLRTLVRRLKGAALWRRSSLAKNSSTRKSSITYAQEEYGGEDAYGEEEMYSAYSPGRDEEEEEDAEEH